MPTIQPLAGAWVSSAAAPLFSFSGTLTPFTRIVGVTGAAPVTVLSSPFITPLAGTWASAAAGPILILSPWIMPLLGTWTSATEAPSFVIGPSSGLFEPVVNPFEGTREIDVSVAPPEPPAAPPGEVPVLVPEPIPPELEVEPPPELTSAYPHTAELSMGI
jgi:hypothetical protein